ncbi:MAG: TIM barrel protein [Candidatus Odinarchaeota archaeon]
MPKFKSVIVGIAAFPLNTFTSDTIVNRVSSRLRAEALNATELLCLSNVLGRPRGGLPGYPSQERANIIGDQLQEFHVSIHGPYTISLTTIEKDKLRTSRAHMTRCLHVADAVGATHVTFHPGSRQGGRIVQTRVRDRLKEFMIKIDDEGLLAVPAPEVAGKIASFGNFDETCMVAGEAGCLFCWDFAHDFARGGDVTTEGGILRRLELIEKHIDLSRWRLPVHLSGIIAGRRGEVQHAPLDGGNHVPWQLFLSVLKEQQFLKKVSIICESKSEEQNNLDFRVEQALQLKNFIESKRIEKEYHTTRPALTQFFSSNSTKDSDEDSLPRLG